MLINLNSCISQRSSSPAGVGQVRKVNETGQCDWERVCPSESGILTFLCLFMFQTVVRPFHFFLNKPGNKDVGRGFSAF